MILPFALMLAVGGPDCQPPADDADRVRCARVELAKAEEEMNSALARAIYTASVNDEAPNVERWSPSREARARMAHEAWLRYRDAQCSAEFLAPAARSLEELNRVWCLTRMTRARTVELDHYRVVD